MQLSLSCFLVFNVLTSMFFHATGHPSLPRKPNLKFGDVIEKQNFKSVWQKCKVLNWQRYLGSKVVEQLPRHPKVKGSSPSAGAGENGKIFSTSTQIRETVLGWGQTFAAVNSNTESTTMPLLTSKQISARNMWPILISFYNCKWCLSSPQLSEWHHNLEHQSKVVS
jgi:hypothetical protein